NRKRTMLAQRYLELLADLPLRLPRTVPNAEHAWHLFTVGTDDRGRLQDALAADGIETGIHYPVPLHMQPALAGDYGSAGAFPNAESISKTTLSLPLYPELSEEAQ